MAPREDILNSIYGEPLEELNKRRASQRDIIQKRVASVEDAPQGVGVSEGIASGIMRLLPAVLGYALAGDQGVLAGVQGSSGAADGYLANVKAETEKQRQTDIFGLQNDREALEDTEQEIGQLSRDKRQEEARLAREESKNQSILSGPDLNVLRKAAQNPDNLALQDQASAIVEEYGIDAAKQFAQERDLARQEIYGDAVKARNERDQEKWAIDRELAAMSGKVPGLEGRIPPKKAEALTDKKTQSTQLAAAASELRDILKEGGDSFTGDQAVQIMTRMQTLIRVQKDKFNMGAALTQLEAALGFMNLPDVMTNPLRGVIGNAFRAKGLKRDPVVVLDELLNQLDNEFLQEVAAYEGQLRVPRDFSFENLGRSIDSDEWIGWAEANGVKTGDVMGETSKPSTGDVDNTGSPVDDLANLRSSTSNAQDYVKRLREETERLRSGR